MQTDFAVARYDRIVDLFQRYRTPCGAPAPPTKAEPAARHSRHGRHPTVDWRTRLIARSKWRILRGQDALDAFAAG